MWNRSRDLAFHHVHPAVRAHLMGAQFATIIALECNRIDQMLSFSNCHRQRQRSSCKSNRWGIKPAVAAIRSSNAIVVVLEHGFQDTRSTKSGVRSVKYLHICVFTRWSSTCVRQAQRYPQRARTHTYTQTPCTGFAPAHMRTYRYGKPQARGVVHTLYFSVFSLWQRAYSAFVFK